MISRKTYTYKVVGDCEIKADVYGITSGALRPAIVYIHGGGLIIFNRRHIPPGQPDMYVNAGYRLISIDYRLAPETKLEAIIEDIRDAFRWVREKGPSLLKIDPNRISVIGHSGGGYLALMTGFSVNPRPKALVSIYGYGDIAGTWYSRPDLFYCKQPSVSKAEAYEAVGGTVISEPSGEQNKKRLRFYAYCRQHGLWPKEVTGHDPEMEPTAFDPFCPIRNVTSEYPPTLLIHGDMDTEVPYEQSVMMANKLAQVGIEHELITVFGGSHGFDFSGIKDPTAAKVLDRTLAFLQRHL